MDLVRMTENECLRSGMEIVYRKEYAVPGSTASSITAFALTDEWNRQDSGMLRYNTAEQDDEPTLDLRFCLTGNRYCSDTECKVCSAKNAESCVNALDTLSLFNFQFTPNYLSQFAGTSKEKKQEGARTRFYLRDLICEVVPRMP